MPIILLEKNPTPVLYEFSPAESYIVTEFAKLRQENKERFRVSSKRFDPQKGDLEIHLLGMRAEYAVSVALGGIPQWQLARGGDSNKGDIVLPNGKTCSVKYRNKAGWDFALQSENKNSFQEDIGVLVYPSARERTLSLFSWITKKEFMEKSTLVDYGYGPRAVVSPSQMHPFIEILRNSSKNFS